MPSARCTVTAAPVFKNFDLALILLLKFDDCRVNLCLGHALFVQTTRNISVSQYIYVSLVV